LEFNGAEDFDLWSRLVEHGDFCFVDDVLLRYRAHPESVMKSGPVEGLIDVQARVIREALARNQVPLDAGQAMELAVITGGSPLDPRQARYPLLQGRLHEIFSSAQKEFEHRHGPAPASLRRVQSNQLLDWARHMVPTSRSYALRLSVKAVQRTYSTVLALNFWKTLATALMPLALLDLLRMLRGQTSIAGRA
jgi:hypothetical protein